MKTIDIFYQGHGIKEIEHLEAHPDQSIATVRRALIERHGSLADTLIFLENETSPLEDHRCVKQISGPTGAKICLHSCRHVEVSVTFAGHLEKKRFAPGTTVARIKHWAAVAKFGMSEAEAGEHRLQISGTVERPAPGIHIGTLTSCPGCRVEFDLVPDERVNGAPREAR